jgi:hypothetical protein
MTLPNWALLTDVALAALGSTRQNAKVVGQAHTATVASSLRNARAILVRNRPAQTCRDVDTDRDVAFDPKPKQRRPRATLELVGYYRYELRTGFPQVRHEAFGD